MAFFRIGGGRSTERVRIECISEMKDGDTSNFFKTPEVFS